jgi:hypothetical protein
MALPFMGLKLISQTSNRSGFRAVGKVSTDRQHEKFSSTDREVFCTVRIWAKIR